MTSKRRDDETNGARPDDERPHYKLLSVLGQGSAGTIYLAYDVRTGIFCALKHLSDECMGRYPNAVARFSREARILLRCEHPNLVSILDCGKAQGRPYIAMELVRGRSLSEYLVKKAVSVPEAVSIAHGVARALDYIHERGIVHRDVKPANILVENDLTPRLADFGLARDASESDLALTGSGIAVGTPRYSSPEQAAGASRNCDGRADIYSLGLLLAAIIVRRPPEIPRTLTEMRTRFEREYLDRLVAAGTPPEVIACCKKATAFEPARRHATAGDFARELLEAIHAQSDRTERSARATTSQRACWRRILERASA